MGWGRVLRRAGPVALVVLAATAAGCGTGDKAERPVATGSGGEADRPVSTGADAAGLPEAIAAASALSGLLTPPNGSTSCGLRPEGTVECWGSGSSSWHQRELEGLPYHGPEGVFAAISTGLGYGCGLRLSGEVDCWGDEDGNLYGVLDAPDGSFVDISGQRRRTCGLRPEGMVECWGGVGELLAGVEAPVPDVVFPGGTFAAISVGGAHVCGLRPGGEVACWGTNWFGQADAPPGRFVAIDAGVSHSCGLRGDGTIACWGEDSLDAAKLIRLGFKFGGDEAAFVANYLKGEDFVTDVLYPSSVALMDLEGAVPEAEVREEMARRAAGWAPPGGPFVAVSAGAGFTCGLRLDGEVACWGYFAREEPRIPLEVYAEVYGPRLWDFHDTTEGDLIAGVMRFNSRFYPFYESLYGARVWELDPREYLIAGPGLLPIKSMVAPVQLVDPPPGPFIAVEAGWGRACGLRPAGELECWGIDDEGTNPPSGPFATSPITAAGAG